MRTGNQRLIIKGGKVVTPFKAMEGCSIIVENGKISQLVQGPCSSEIEKNSRIINAHGMIVTPGLIDVHTHGGIGEDCLGGDLRKISRFKVEQGVTGYIATFTAAPLEMIHGSIERIMEFKLSGPRDTAHILGINIEGLYLNPKWRGAQPLIYLRRPNTEECKELIERSAGNLKLMTVSPELEGCMDVIEVLSQSGVVPSVGHSSASAREIDHAIARGLKGITHIFNAMDGNRFSEPGVRGVGCAEVALVRDELTAEVIGELTHVHPVMMEILLRTKGSQRIIIVTDSLSVSGLPPGKHKIGVFSFNLEEGATIVRLDNGSLAGSVISLNRAAKIFLDNTTASLNQVIQMVTYNPAALLGLSSTKGSIEVGKDADIAVFDKDLVTMFVLVEGRLVYTRNPEGS